MNFLREGGWLYLIPGFVALFVAGLVSDFPSISDSQLPISYVSLTLLSAAIPLAATQIIFRVRHKRIPLSELIWKPYFGASVLIFSVIFGLLFGIFYTTDAASTLLRETFGERIVSIVSYAEPLRDLFRRSYSGGLFDGRPDFRDETTSHYIRIVFKNESVEFEGVADKWYGGKSSRQVYLTPACIIKGRMVMPVRGPGVWVDLKGVRQIQFIDDICSVCASALERLGGRKPSDACPYNKNKNSSKLQQ